MVRPLCSLAGVLLLAGCGQPWKTDPNVSRPDDPVSGPVLARNIAGLMADLDERVAKGGLPGAAKDQMIAEYLDRTLAGIDPQRVPDDECWQFGDAYRLKGEWKVAMQLYQRAVASAKDEDRSVNDRLRLARAMAHFGEHENAIKTARSTFEASPTNKAPILMAVLYEIVPEAKGKGADKEYAQLLLDAVRQHQETIVDANSPEGAAFLETRVVHIRAAYILAASMLSVADEQDAARTAIEDAQKAAAAVTKI